LNVLFEVLFLFFAEQEQFLKFSLLFLRLLHLVVLKVHSLLSFYGFLPHFFLLYHILNMLIHKVFVLLSEPHLQILSILSFHFHLFLIIDPWLNIFSLLIQQVDILLGCYLVVIFLLLAFFFLLYLCNISFRLGVRFEIELSLSWLKSLACIKITAVLREILIHQPVQEVLGIVLGIRVSCFEFGLRLILLRPNGCLLDVKHACKLHPLLSFQEFLLFILVEWQALLAFLVFLFCFRLFYWSHHPLPVDLI
jgi:hypothetical protein